MNDLRNKVLSLIETKQKWLKQWHAPVLLSSYDRQVRSDMIQVLSDNIAELEEILADLDKATPKEPVKETPYPGWKPGCQVCGAHGAQGYVCPRMDCPTRATCGDVV